MFNVNWICWWMLRMSNESQIERHQTVSYWCYSVHPATRQHNAEATDSWYYSWEFSKMTTLGDRWMFQWSTWRHCLDAAFGVAYLTEHLQKFHTRPGKVHWFETLWIGSSQSRRPHSSLMLDRSIGCQHHSLELQTDAERNTRSWKPWLHKHSRVRWNHAWYTMPTMNYDNTTNCWIHLQWWPSRGSSLWWQLALSITLIHSYCSKCLRAHFQWRPLLPSCTKVIGPGLIGQWRWRFHTMEWRWVRLMMRWIVIQEQ